MQYYIIIFRLTLVLHRFIMVVATENYEVNHMSPTSFNLSDVEHFFSVVWNWGGMIVLTAIAIRILLPYWKGGR